jgi:hypothetical protein
MSEVLAEAIGKMLMAFGSRLDPVRVDAFVESLEDANLCAECGAVGAKRLTARQKRVPVPFDLIGETRDVQESAEHQAHVADHAQLGPGDLHAWWVTQAPAHIKKVWPQLDSNQAISVAQRLEQFGYVRPTVDAIVEELEDRSWWLGMYADLRPVPPPDARIPVGDR